MSTKLVSRITVALLLYLSENFIQPIEKNNEESINILLTTKNK